MTKNLTGGKNHKKTKQGADKPKIIDKQDDQLYARVIQILGNRNVLAFCNDNKIRLCHIRGSIRKDMWISTGDIVLISIRDFLIDKDGKYEKGDILFKYDRDIHSKLKKDNDINNKLFLTLETMDTNALRTIVGKTIHLEDNEDIFEGDKEESEESEESVDIDNI